MPKRLRRLPDWDIMLARLTPEIDSMTEGAPIDGQLDRDAVDAAVDLLGALLRVLKVPLSFDASRTQEAADLESTFAEDDDDTRASLMLASCYWRYFFAGYRSRGT